MRTVVVVPARIQVDDAEIERLYFDEGLNAAQVGEEIGCSPNTVLRRLAERERARRAPGRPVKHPPVELGVCGAAGCTNPECEVPYGECHCPQCGRRENRWS